MKSEKYNLAALDQSNCHQTSNKPWSDKLRNCLIILLLLMCSIPAHRWMTGLIMKLSEADKDTSFHLSDIVFWSKKEMFGLFVSWELSAHRPHCRTKKDKGSKKQRRVKFCLHAESTFLPLCIICYRWASVVVHFCKLMNLLF